MRVVSLNVLIFHINFTLVHYHCIMHCHDLHVYEKGVQFCAFVGGSIMSKLAYIYICWPTFGRLVEGLANDKIF